MVSADGIFSGSQFENFSAALKGANEWIAENGIDVINIETVVFPNIWSPGEKGPRDPEITVRPNEHVYWYQFIRVWYRKEG